MSGRDLGRRIRTYTEPNVLENTLQSLCKIGGTNTGKVLHISCDLHKLFVQSVFVLTAEWKSCHCNNSALHIPQYFQILSAEKQTNKKQQQQQQLLCCRFFVFFFFFCCYIQNRVRSQGTLLVQQSGAQKAGCFGFESGCSHF